MLEALEQGDQVDAYEINISCPNVDAGGMTIGTDPASVEKVIGMCRATTSKPMIVKLTPNVTDIVSIAQAAVSAGADALSMINTYVGMRIDVKTGKPIIANVTGGVSGHAVHPMAVACVYKVRKALPQIPIIAMGGVYSGEDALEFLYAGANAVEVGTAALADPAAPIRVAAELDELLDERPELSVTTATAEYTPGSSPLAFIW